jgi:SET domain-containing protein
MSESEKLSDETTEFSFILKPAVFGIGVFAVHNIRAGTFLRLFGDGNTTVLRNTKDVPGPFRQFSVDRGEAMYCPKDFGCMSVGWYLNHSKMPNAHHKNYAYFALRDICADEEITIDYTTLEEPHDDQSDFYLR